MSNIKRLHFKDLNGLRFIGFLPVFLFLTTALLKNDKSPISINIFNLVKTVSISSFDFFFFLSSFLLTSLALREIKYRESFSLKKFYIRKLLRILPLLIVLFVFAFYFHDKIISFLKLTPIQSQSMTKYLIGIPNYFQTIINERYAYSVVLWIVFMFLQFYFVWGLVLKFFKTKIVYISFLIIILGITSRLYHCITDSEFYFDTISYGVSIGFGVILASIVRNNNQLIDRFKVLKKMQLRLIYVFGILSTTTLYIMVSKGVGVSIAPVINCLFFGFIILEQTYCKKSLFKLRKIKLLNRLGKVSYGLLIFTPIMGTILVIVFESIDKGIESLIYKLLFIITTFVFTIVAAEISYNSIEKLFSRIKRDFKRV